jgi:hypothetical protein
MPPPLPACLPPQVLERVPTSPVPLMQLLSQHVPHKLRDRNAQCAYFSALFSLAEAPSGAAIRDAVLAVAVEQLLALDVEIRWEEIVDEHTGGMGRCLRAACAIMACSHHHHVGSVGCVSRHSLLH